MSERQNKDPSGIEISQLEEILMIALLNKELYGLQIAQAMCDASGGTRKVNIGSLYPTLHKLERKGLIESRWGDDRPDERGGARRRYYKMTALGSRVLDEIQGLRTNLMTWQPI